MKIAIVHDWLVTYAGAERVLEQMLIVLPNADVFSVIDFIKDGPSREFLQGKKVGTTFIQKIPSARKNYRALLPLMPLAIEQIDLSDYDLVISSSHAVAKGILIGPDQLHICYCHSPIRYAWDMQHQYLSDAGLDSGLKSWFIRWLLHRLRLWDVRSANSVDFFVANSKYIKRRINKVYRRDAKVIYPPVDTCSFDIAGERGDYYLAASRLVAYKKMHLIVEAFACMPSKQLVVIGDGPDFDKIKKMATSNVQILGYKSTNILKHYMQRAKAFVFAAEEDFGIIPVEAQACGTPVIAFSKGGANEVVKDLHHSEPTGIFFDKQTKESIVCAIDLFEKNSESITPTACRTNSLRFSAAVFRRNFADYVAECCKDGIRYK